MALEQYRKLVLERIVKGHFHVLKKAVPKKKSPTGKSIPAVKERVASCATKALLGKDILRRGHVSAESDANDELRRMRDEGVIHCTNKMWWIR